MSSSIDEADEFFKQMVAEEQAKINKVNAIYATMEKATNTTAKKKVQKPAQRDDIMQFSLSSFKEKKEVAMEVDETPKGIVEIKSPQELLQSMQYHLNTLTPNSNRNARVDALNKIYATVQKQPEQILKEIYIPEFYQPIFKQIGDSVEACREQAIEIVLFFVKTIKSSTESSWKYLFPILKARWFRKEQYTEPSEEVRLKLITLINECIKHCYGVINTYNNVEELFNDILANAYLDYYAIKKEAFAATVELCKVCPMIHLKSGEITEKVAPHLTNARSDVRVSAIKALESLVFNGGSAKLEEILPTLKNLAVDANSAVREQMAKTACNWIKFLKDRYNHEYYLIQLLLLALVDDVEKIRNNTCQVFEEIGQRYEMEHEDDIKELTDYVLEDLGDNKDLYPAPFTSRPRIGARQLVKEYVRRVLPNILEGLVEWNLKTRLVSAKVVQVLIVFCEKDITQFSDKILTNVFKTINDDEIEVRREVEKIPLLLGRFVDPDGYLKYVFSHLKPEYATAPLLLRSVLQALKCLITGARLDNLKPYIVGASGISISAELSLPHLIYHDSIDVKSWIFKVVDCIFEKAGAAVAQDILGFLLLIVKTSSQPNASLLSQQAQELIKKLVKYSGEATADSLFLRFFPAMLDNLLLEAAAWDKTSPDLFTLEGLAKLGPSVLAGQIDKLAPLMQRYMEDMDKVKLSQSIDVRVRLFSVFANIFQHAGPKLLPIQVEYIFAKVIMPNCVWRAGNTPALVRKLACSCLASSLKHKILTQNCLDMLAQEQPLKHIIACLEEDDTEHRMLTVTLFSDLLQAIAPQLKTEQWKEIQSELVKRLNDSSDAIRIQTTKTLITLFKTLPHDFEDKELKATVEALAIHLNDSSVHIQGAVFEALKHCVNRELAVQAIHSAKEQFPNSSKLNQLLELAKQRQ